MNFILVEREREREVMHCIQFNFLFFLLCLNEYMLGSNLVVLANLSQNTLF